MRYDFPKPFLFPQATWTCTAYLFQRVFSVCCLPCTSFYGLQSPGLFRKTWNLVTWPLKKWKVSVLKGQVHLSDHVSYYPHIWGGGATWNSRSPRSPSPFPNRLLNATILLHLPETTSAFFHCSRGTWRFQWSTRCHHARSPLVLPPARL